MMADEDKFLGPGLSWEKDTLLYMGKMPKKMKAEDQQTDKMFDSRVIQIIKREAYLWDSKALRNLWAKCLGKLSDCS